MVSDSLFIKWITWAKLSLVRHRFKGYKMQLTFQLGHEYMEIPLWTIPVHTAQIYAVSPDIKWPLLHPATGSEEELPPSVPTETDWWAFCSRSSSSPVVSDLLIMFSRLKDVCLCVYTYIQYCAKSLKHPTGFSNNFVKFLFDQFCVSESSTKPNI